MEYIKSFFHSLYSFAVKYPLAIAGTIALVVAAVFCSAFGKQFQIGGLLGRLWGKKESPIDVTVLPPSNRKDDHGTVIQPGTPDNKGWVQTPATIEIKDPGMFSNPSTIVIVHPDKGELEIPLPTGIKNKDVKSVVEISPDVYQIHNNDHGVDTADLLKKL